MCCVVMHTSQCCSVVYRSNAWSIETGYAGVSHSLSPSLSHKSNVLHRWHYSCDGYAPDRGSYIITFIQHKTHTVHAGAECSQIYFNCCLMHHLEVQCEIFCNIALHDIEDVKRQQAFSFIFFCFCFVIFL